MNVQPNVNTGLMYASRTLQNETYHNFIRVYKEICKMDKMRVEFIKALIKINPTLGMRLWTKRDDIIAAPAGEAYHVIRCHAVHPLHIYWDHQNVIQTLQ
jgi:hypothetical protein